MAMWGWVLLGLVGLAVLLFAWGVWRIRRRFADAEALALTVIESEISGLAEECARGFADRLGVQLPGDAPAEAARVIELALGQDRQLDTALAFEKPDHPGWYVRPLGAFLGELIRRHAVAPARWHPSEMGGLGLTLGEGNETVTLHPFDKILKQLESGEPGDLVAYVELSRQNLSEIVRRSSGTNS